MHDAPLAISVSPFSIVRNDIAGYFTDPVKKRMISICLRADRERVGVGFCFVGRKSCRGDSNPSKNC
jgi:hypothetical protein